MILSMHSRNFLDRLRLAGGSLPQQGNMREGNALYRRKLVTWKRGQIVITAVGRKFLEKNPHV